jgi:hypothetical protein
MFQVHLDPHTQVQLGTRVPEEREVNRRREVCDLHMLNLCRELCRRNPHTKIYYFGI